MSKIMIRCPATGGEIATGVETDAASFKSLPNSKARVVCPLCGETHSWVIRDAWLAGFEKTLPPRGRAKSSG